MIFNLHTKATVSAPALWGKIPSHGDFVRHQLPYQWDDALKAWIEKTFQPLPQHLPMQPAKMSYSGMPWCFVLPPGNFSFALSDYVIGVWMSASDKLGRQYPLVMLQTANTAWVRQYFMQHAQQPCDWLFSAARLLAHAVYTSPHSSPTDAIITLTRQLDAMWKTIQPQWSTRFYRRSHTAEAISLSSYLPPHHPDDYAATLHGVKHMPWSDWPQCLTEASPEPLFWQQDHQGRYVNVIQHHPEPLVDGDH
jgi:type VI secretion system protein ImpM